MYHYKESGLDNVFLENGYQVHKTPYGEGVSITESVALHQAIGQWLIFLPKPLNGAELRFLRVEMDTTQRHLAGIIGATEQTLRLWEKHRKKSIPGPADRLVRTLYSEFIGGDGSIRRRLEKLADLDQLEHADACFQQEENRRWKCCTSTALDMAEQQQA
ncbi:MAG: transcriptional regulator [Alphaproteobacteria bacterium]|nr:transcriptional regulator [Alphaproteobacteria bacterium]